MVPKGPSALPGGHFAPHGLAQRSSERCSIISRLRSQLAFATPLNAVSLPDRRISAKRQKGVLAFGSLFQLRELCTFLGALPTSFPATGKRLNLGMLIASFGEFLASARTDIAEWICGDLRSKILVLLIATGRLATSVIR